MKYDKSPMNYIGGKFKLLPQILPLFPKKINTFLDIFAGGCDISANVSKLSSVERIHANDLNPFTIKFYKTMQRLSIETLLEKIEGIIETWQLSMYNKQGFMNFQNHYNLIPVDDRDPLEFFCLMAHSFNNQMRFNQKLDCVSSFGYRRSHFNPVMRDNLIKFHKNIQKITFINLDFSDFHLDHLNESDFVYVDPPYKISNADYNHGKAGFARKWGIEEDLLLFKLLDQLNDQGVRWALSNITEHKGMSNTELAEWMTKYNVKILEKDYNHCNYQSKNRQFKTIEVLVTNYPLVRRSITLFPE